MPVDLPRLLNGEQILPRYPFHVGIRRLDHPFDPGYADLPAQFAMPLDKRLDRRRIRGLANPVRHVKRVKIRVRQETVHRAELDMVGIHVVRPLPAQFFGRCIRRSPRGRGLGTDDEMFAVRLVPNGDDLEAVRGCHHASAKLGFGLVREAVADPDRQLLEFQECGQLEADI